MGKGMSKILPGLYIGSFEDSTDSDQLTKYKVSHIISACNVAAKAIPGSKIKRMVVDVEDKPTASISPHFLRCIEFIQQARAEEGVVLVHCVAGVSRSVIITAAYLLAISDLTWRQAISCIRACRSVANPNLGFQKQLQDWCEAERWNSIESVKQHPEVPYNDKHTLDHLLEKHEKWIETGKYNDDDLYPLAPGAYKPQHTGADDGQLSSNTEVASGSSPTKGERRRQMMREAVRSRILSERKHEARMAELDTRELQISGAVCSPSEFKTGIDVVDTTSPQLPSDSLSDNTIENPLTGQPYRTRHGATCESSPVLVASTSTYTDHVKASHSDSQFTKNHSFSGWTTSNTGLKISTDSPLSSAVTGPSPLSSAATGPSASADYEYVQWSEQLDND